MATSHPSCSPLSPSPGVRRALSRRAGFTVAEVMMATFVMALGISSSIIAIKSGYRALDTARNTTLAAQIIQSELERVRLLPWSTTSLQSNGSSKSSIIGNPQASNAGALTNTTDLDPTTIFPAGTTTNLIADRFTIARTVTDVPNRSGEIKSITLTVTWKGIDGAAHSRTSSTEYAKNGLYDYYFTKADRRS